MGLGVLDIGDWSKPKVLIYEAFHNLVAFAEGDVHLDGSLAVPDVVRLLFGDAVHVGEEGGQIVVGHVLEGKLPKLLVFVWIVLGVVAGVLISPAVAKPDIVSLIGEHEPRCLVLVIDEPGVGTVEQAVLQDDGLESVPDETVLSLYSEHRENVAVLSDDLMCLDGVVVVFAVISELELGLGVGSLDQGQKGDEQQQVYLHWGQLQIIYNKYNVNPCLLYQPLWQHPLGEAVQCCPKRENIQQR